MIPRHSIPKSRLLWSFIHWDPFRKNVGFNYNKLDYLFSFFLSLTHKNGKFFRFFFLFLKLLRPFFKRFKKNKLQKRQPKKIYVGAMGISLSHVYRKLILGGVGANKGFRWWRVDSISNRRDEFKKRCRGRGWEKER